MKGLIFKILLLSERGTGTKSIIKRFINNNFENDYSELLNCNWFSKNIKINDCLITNYLWHINNIDSAITKQYTESTNGIIYLFDLSRVETINFPVKAYKKINIDCEKILIGTKSDLYNESLEEHIKQSIKEMNEIKFYKTSIKDNNFNEAIIELDQRIKERLGH